jgi:hypothetical protein
MYLTASSTRLSLDINCNISARLVVIQVMHNVQVMHNRLSLLVSLTLNYGSLNRDFQHLSYYLAEIWQLICRVQ